MRAYRLALDSLEREEAKGDEADIELDDTVLLVMEIRDAIRAERRGQRAAKRNGNDD